MARSHSGSKLLRPLHVLPVRQNRAQRLDERLRGAATRIVSPGSRRTDEVVKRKLYDRVGVREYWVVDPELEVVKVYRREGERLTRPGESSREEGHTLSTPLLPGLSIALDDLFR